MNRSHGVVSEAHPHRTTLSGSGTTTPWTSGPCLLCFGLPQESRAAGGMLLCKYVLLAVSERARPLCPEESLCVWAAVHCGGRRGKQACKLPTSDILRGNQSYFLWIALSFISLQINLVTADTAQQLLLSLSLLYPRCGHVGADFYPVPL